MPVINRTPNGLFDLASEFGKVEEICSLGCWTRDCFSMRCSSANLQSPIASESGVWSTGPLRLGPALFSSRGDLRPCLRRLIGSSSARHDRVVGTPHG